MINKRASGILMHISSLPGDYSAGSLGNRAYRFVDFLADSGFSYWQVLPLCMADDCASPYKSWGYYSANPYFIDLEILYEEGLVTLDEVNSARQNNPYVAEYERLERERLEILFRAAGRYSCKCKVDSFIDTHPGVKSLALYLALRDKNGRAPFRDWKITDPDPDRLFAWQFIQYEFHREWQMLKSYANSRGISIIGDITKTVKELVEYSTFPGMRVLQFGFLGGDSLHLPHNYPANSVAYSGTHDNNTLLGYIWEMDSDTRARAFSYMGIHHTDWSLAARDMMLSLLRSPSGIVIFPIQDILGFGSDTRMNIPGEPSGNWRFRITDANLNDLLGNSGKWRELNPMFGRN